MALMGGVAEVRAGTAPGQVARVVELLRKDGVATLAALSEEAGVAPELVVATVEVAGREVPLIVDRAAGIAFRKDVDAEGARRLPGIVGTAGRITLDEIGRELQAPLPLVRRWVQEAVGAGRLHGAVDWKAGVRSALSIPPSRTHLNRRW